MYAFKFNQQNTNYYKLSKNGKICKKMFLRTLEFLSITNCLGKITFLLVNKNSVSLKKFYEKLAFMQLYQFSEMCTLT